jgi:hypothetical protein
VEKFSLKSTKPTLARGDEMITLTREEAQQVLAAFVNWDARGRLRLIETLRARLAEKEQEPVAWISKHGVVYPLDAKDEVNPVNELQPLYTAPPKRPWQGLTDEEIRNEAKNHVFDESFFSGAIWARGKMMGKNYD